MDKKENENNTAADAIGVIIMLIGIAAAAYGAMTFL
jgi:uncharacterized membrane protein YidH (DUF202 family)